MNRIFYLFIFLVSTSLSFAQKPLPPKAPKGKTIDLQQLQLLKSPAHSEAQEQQSTLPGIPISGNAFFNKSNAHWRVGATGKNGLPCLIHGNDRTSSTSRSTKANAFAYLNSIKAPIQIKEPEQEFHILEEKVDNNGQQHIKMQQTFNGLKVYGGEIWVHESNKQGVDLFTGSNFPTPTLSNLHPSIGQEQAIELALQDVAQHTTVSTDNTINHPFYQAQEQQAELVIYHPSDDISNERLTWELTVHPNNVSHWKYFIDAQTGEVLHHYSTICQLDHKVGRQQEDCQLEDHHSTSHYSERNESKYSFGGPESVQATDLNGATKLISTYELNGTFYMLDVTKPMFNSRNSQLPNDPVGAVWTLNARNTTPASSRGFEPAHITTTGNNWNSELGALGVSAHANASQTYDYFLNTFNRNSVNGRGGNIISFINVADENGQSMENAFWDGQYIYYGNGGRDFRELALSLIHI